MHQRQLLLLLLHGVQAARRLLLTLCMTGCCCRCCIMCRLLASVADAVHDRLLLSLLHHVQAACVCC
jgi:hypothetical protein